jgi:hypothetical protein
VRTLWIAAGVETASLVVLLTTHTKAITTFVGPLHGSAYVVVIAAAALVPAATSSGAQWRAPPFRIGGLHALRKIRKFEGN